MADEGRTCSSPRGFTKGNTRSRVIKCSAIFILLLLMLVPSVHTARSINACQHGKKQVPGSNSRRLSSNQFNVPRNASGPPGQYNAGKHEVPSGPNPISNR
ncbi:hypothetical protein SUGI_0416380 [Cryptomeria japonica]|nr:hypothetical protein SUGI_0416380 [Cryptomeria japonica]